jgi:hypothetical protein
VTRIATGPLARSGELVLFLPTESALAAETVVCGAGNLHFLPQLRVTHQTKSTF